MTVKRIVGIRNTSNSTRGQWKYESVVVEFEDGTIKEVDARLTEEVE